MQNHRFEKFNPVWHRKETDHFKVLFQKDYIDAETVYKELSEAFNLKLDFKITVYITDKLKRYYPGRIYRSYYEPKKRKIVASNEHELRHELTHALFHSLSKDAPVLLQEGIATYKSNNYRPTEKVDLDCVAGDFDLRKRELIGYGDFAVTQAWVGALIENGGIEKFKALYKRVKDKDSLKKAMEEIYGTYNLSSSQNNVHYDRNAFVAENQAQRAQILCRLNSAEPEGGETKGVAKRVDWHSDETRHFSVKFLNNCYIDVEALYDKVSRRFGKGLKDRVSIFILKNTDGESWSQIDRDGKFVVWATDKKGLAHHLAHILFVQNGEEISEASNFGDTILNSD